jgi:hypothetical protein
VTAEGTEHSARLTQRRRFSKRCGPPEKTKAPRRYHAHLGAFDLELA